MTNESTNSLISLKVELQKQLEFINRIIEADRIKLEQYRELHGDLYKRTKINAQGYGPPSDTLLVPSIIHYKATIKSILDSITLVDKALSGAYDETSSSESEECDEYYSDSGEWDAQAFLAASKGKNRI